MSAPKDQALAVIDTNVALDLFLFLEPRVAPLAEALAVGRLCWLACPRMGDELADVLQRGLAQARGAETDAVLAAWQAAVTMAPAPATQPRLRCDDPDDQVFLDLALEAGAGWLISRDRAVLRLARRARALGFTICTPEAWQAAMSSTPP